MIEAQVRVVEIAAGGLAYVESKRESSCGSCKEAEGGCGTASLANILGKKSSSFKVLNAIEARIGDTVIVGIAEGVLLKTSFIIYLLPLFSLFLGALAAHWFFAGSPDETYVILGSFVGLIFGFSIMGFVSRYLAKKTKFLPVILRQLELKPIIVQLRR